MIDEHYEALWRHLPDWSSLLPQIRERLEANGTFPRWREAVLSLPQIEEIRSSWGDTVRVDGELSSNARDAARAELEKLLPWRKGPFSFFDIEINTEWRSDFKWRRVAPHVDLANKRVLDIGSGNGYFGWRMLEAGAELVIGIDTMILFCAQHFAVNKYFKSDRNWVLPFRFEQIDPELTRHRFDTVFSMGVLYHQRDHYAHLSAIRECLAPEGEAVIESLIVQNSETLYPTGRYAQMRNVWNVPSPEDLCRWVLESGFKSAEVVDINVTSLEEQRQTEWMKYDSLVDFLDPCDITKTVEGYPAPTRCTVIARTTD
jgi:tRNA (mo5U34)-methyltransferase